MKISEMPLDELKKVLRGMGMPEEMLPNAPAKGNRSYTVHSHGAIVEVQVSKAAFYLKKNCKGEKYKGKQQAFGWTHKGVASAWKLSKKALGWDS